VDAILEGNVRDETASILRPSRRERRRSSGCASASAARASTHSRDRPRVRSSRASGSGRSRPRRCDSSRSRARDASAGPDARRIKVTPGRKAPGVLPCAGPQRATCPSVPPFRRRAIWASDPPYQEQGRAALDQCSGRGVHDDTTTRNPNLELILPVCRDPWHKATRSETFASPTHMTESAPPNRSLRFHQTPQRPHK